jgi:hypothetical protein
MPQQTPEYIYAEKPTIDQCKSPKLDNPITEAIRDLLQYSNQRGSSQPEGAEKLFHYNQLMIAASRGRAAAGTIGANYEHYVEWKDVRSPQPPLKSYALVASFLTIGKADGIWVWRKRFMLLNRRSLLNSEAKPEISLFHHTYERIIE